MSSTFWDTSDRSGLLGPDPDLWDDDDHHFDYYDEEPQEQEGCCAMGCMECLGLHWSDFF